MPKGTNQKLKLYYLSRIMTEKTDDEHHITMPEIQRALGFPEELGSQIAKQLGSPKAMSRMMGYLVNVRPKSAELIVDEMLAICSGPRSPVDVGFGRTVAERRP